MKIHLLHQAVSAEAGADERDVLDQAAAVAAALARAGHAVTVRPVTLDLDSLARDLRAAAPALVFNLVESLHGADRLLPCVPALVETLSLPCSGNPSAALFTTTHKPLAKQRLRAAGLPTPDWIAAAAAAAAESAAAVSGDWLLKTVWDHASAGVQGANLLRGAIPAAARARIDELTAAQGGDWFAEAYIEGREFNLSLLEGAEGVTALPPAEILFLDYPAGKPRILDYEAKWDERSFAYTHTPRSFDLPASDAPLLETLRRLALACWRTFGLRGYARVDFRVDAAGQPWILEINANPCLAPDAGFAAALARAGIAYDEAIARLVAAALQAAPVPLPTPAAPFQTTDENRGPGTENRNPPALRYRRDVVAEDVGRIRALVAATGYFHESEVDVAVELAQERLRLGAASGYEFLLAEEADGTLAGYSCFGPTPCTESSFDLYWIAVAPRCQGRGLGRELEELTVRAVRAMGGTRLYAETSSRPQYVSTRTFYERRGYTLASMLDDFYGPGDGKATYLKRFPG